MGFNLKVLLYVGGITLTIGLFFYCLLNTQYYATMLTLSLVFSFQIIALLRFISVTNRELTRFLSAVKHSDFSQSFSSSNQHSSFKELGAAFNEVIERFRSERSDKEAQAIYLQAFVQQMPIGMFALNEDGRIPISNNAFRKLLGLSEINHLKQISSFDNKLGEFITELEAGKEQTLNITRNNESFQLKMACTLLRSKGVQQKLVSISNIQSELEASELEAWQNLIRVMTHEIMNSITPITSLADTADQCVKDSTELLASQTEESSITEINNLLEDASNAVTTIGRRSQGLMRFVESYRTLTRLPTPKYHHFRLLELFQSIEKLMAKQAQTLKLDIQFNCKPATLELNADQELLEQALINLVKNSLEALTETSNPTLKIKAELLERGKLCISVTDNGQGIDKENLKNIFIPFFTTKRGGSGIGMSIVRQIVRLNGGKVNVISEKDQGTSVIMNFM